MTDVICHTSKEPSAWVCRFASMIRSAGSVLDVACGTGRHALYLSGLGLRVEAVDRDIAALRQLDGAAGVSTRLADLEEGLWPYHGCRFDAVVVTNYLYRPLLPLLLDALAPDGVLLYETFAVGNERFGRPSNPSFLLKQGELLDMARNRLRVIAYEDLQVDVPKRAMVQRLCAVSG